MRLSQDEIAELKIDVKAWTGAMQIAGRGAEAPTFELPGPVMLEVRKRKLSGPVATGKGNHAFMGGEKFRLSGMHVEKLDHVDAVNISAQFVPAEPTLAAEVAGMTLSLQEAMEQLTGFEAFALQFRGALPKAKTPAAVAAEVHESDPSWGCW